MKTIRVCTALALVALLMGCTAQNANPSPTAVTPSPTATATAPARAMGTKNFGRYAAAIEDALYYASGNAIWCYQRGGTAKLCDVPSGQVPEDLYVPSADALYFTARLEAPNDRGYDRNLYRIPLGSDTAALELHAQSSGPMSVRGDTIHVLQNGEGICINAADGAQLSCANLGVMARLIAGDTDGIDLYYNVYTQSDNGIPFGEAELVRLNMDTKESELIGSMYKAGSDSVLHINENMVYMRKTSEDGSNYLFTILDSKSGGMDAPYPVPKSVIDDQHGSETLYLTDKMPHMLVMSQSGDQTILTCYLLKEDAATESWKTNIAQPVVSTLYNEQNECIVVLSEGDANATFNLFTLDALSGAQIQTYAGQFGATEAQLLLCDVGGTALVFTPTGEDIPNATLLYAAALDDLAAPLLTGAIAAAGEE